MAVYVDHMSPSQRWGPGGRYRESCHLIADTPEELRSFAVRLGLLSSWFRPHEDVPHYDLVRSKRRTAVAMGVIELTRNGMVARLREARGKRTGISQPPVPGPHFVDEAMERRVRP